MFQPDRGACLRPKGHVSNRLLGIFQPDAGAHLSPMVGHISAQMCVSVNPMGMSQPECGHISARLRPARLDDFQTEAGETDGMNVIALF